MRVTAGHSLTGERPNNSRACLSREPSSRGSTTHSILETNQSHGIGPRGVNPSPSICVPLLIEGCRNWEITSGWWEDLFSLIIILVLGVCVYSWGLNYITDRVGKGHLDGKIRPFPLQLNCIFFHISIWKSALMDSHSLASYIFSLAALTLAYSRKYYSIFSFSLINSFSASVEYKLVI